MSSHRPMFRSPAAESYAATRSCPSARLPLMQLRVANRTAVQAPGMPAVDPCAARIRYCHAPRGLLDIDPDSDAFALGYASVVCSRRRARVRVEPRCVPKTISFVYDIDAPRLGVGISIVIQVRRLVTRPFSAYTCPPISTRRLNQKTDLKRRRVALHNLTRL